MTVFLDNGAMMMPLDLELTPTPSYLQLKLNSLFTMFYSHACFSVSKWYHWPNQTSDVIWLSQQGFQKHLTGGCKWKAFIHMHKALPSRELKTPVKKGIIFFYIYKILYPRLTNTENMLFAVSKNECIKNHMTFLKSFTIYQW